MTPLVSCAILLVIFKKSEFLEIRSASCDDDAGHSVELVLSESDIQLITPWRGCGKKADASSLFCCQLDDVKCD
jgi:hypothetical protein